ncbi:MAG: polysaccharide deacetylase family protein [Gammaproteobacteria bacterium]
MRFIYSFVVVLVIIFPCVLFADNKQLNIPIILYHNLNPTIPGSMTVTPLKFEANLKLLKDNGFTFIPLKEAVEYLQGKRDTLPPKPVVLTADDGWESVYTYMYPIVKKLNIPATLFIYPESISSSKHFLTWDQLTELKNSGLFDIQGHTYSHPNFKIAKRKMSTAAYEQFVQKELFTSKKILEDKMGTKVTLLAWPFGIYNDYLEKQAAKAGYVMAFTIGYRVANRSFKPMEQPRFMIVDKLDEQTFKIILGSYNRKKPATESV